MEQNIAAEMRRIIGREGDRVIGAVLAGPHERILDPVCTQLHCHRVLKMFIAATQDIYDIWKDMASNSSLCLS